MWVLHRQTSIQSTHGHHTTQFPKPEVYAHVFQKFSGFTEFSWLFGISRVLRSFPDGLRDQEGVVAKNGPFRYNLGAYGHYNIIIIFYSENKVSFL